MDRCENHWRLRPLVVVVVVGPLALDEGPHADRPSLNEHDGPPVHIRLRCDCFRYRGRGRSCHGVTPLKFCQLSPWRPDTDDNVVDAERSGLLTSVKPDSWPTQRRCPLALDGEAYRLREWRVNEWHRHMLARAPRTKRVL